jgi:hypothetical protein
MKIYGITIMFSHRKRDHWQFMDQFIFIFKEYNRIDVLESFVD